MTAARHDHLWSLPDGTGLHAPFAELVVEESSGRMCCHLCGRWFRSLGSHVRAHGHTAATYREAMGLCTGVALTCADLSTSLSLRATRRWVDEDDLRAEFAAGRSQLRAGAGGGARSGDGAPEPAQRRAVRRRSLAAGRATVATRREEARAARLHELGFDDCDEFLRSAYAAGASLSSLARNTGLGRAALRERLRDAGIEVRASGHTTPAGRRSRALRAEEEAAARLGTDDLHGWLVARRADGWSLAALARATRRSYHWVSWRLDERLTG